MEEPIDGGEWEADDDASDEDPEGIFMNMAERRIWENRQQRPEREAALIEAAEKVWEEAIAAQHANRERVKESMRLLVGEMNALEKIEVDSWKFGKFMGLEVERCVDTKTQGDILTTDINSARTWMSNGGPARSKSLTPRSHGTCSKFWPKVYTTLVATSRICTSTTLYSHKSMIPPVLSTRSKASPG